MNFLTRNIKSYFGILLLNGIASHLSLQAATTITDINLTDITVNGVPSGTTGTVHGGVIFSRSVQNGSTGSGTFRRLFNFGDTNNDLNGNDNISEAYNFDGNTGSRPYDQGSANGFDPTLTVGQLPIVTIGGKVYVEFIWDINESGGNGSYLSLDRLEIYTNPSTNPVLTTDRFTSGPDMNYADLSKLDDNYGQGAGLLI